MVHLFSFLFACFVHSLYVVDVFRVVVFRVVGFVSRILRETRDHSFV